LTRGFVQVSESEALVESTRNVVRRLLQHKNDSTEIDAAFVIRKIKDGVGDHLYEQTRGVRWCSPSSPKSKKSVPTHG
jgi:hypothetical protein